MKKIIAGLLLITSFAITHLVQVIKPMLCVAGVVYANEVKGQSFYAIVGCTVDSTMSARQFGTGAPLNNCTSPYAWRSKGKLWYTSYFDSTVYTKNVWMNMADSTHSASLGNAIGMFDNHGKIIRVEWATAIAGISLPYSQVTGTPNLTPYLLSATAASTYEPLLGFTPYNATNPSGYITSSALSSYLTSAIAASTYQAIGTYVSPTRTISTTSPLTGGGDLSANRTFAINNSAADNATKGAASFDSSYFDAVSGNISFVVNYGTGTVSANAVTINAPRGKITVGSPSIAALTNQSITLTNSYITATSTINVGVNGNGANLILGLNCYVKSQTAGSAVINLLNLSLLSVFSTSIILDYFVVN